jgi:prefoldin subunit 5
VCKEDGKARSGTVGMLVEDMAGGVKVAVWGNNPFGIEYERFKAWLRGWLMSMYKVSECYDCDFIAFTVDKEDMFEVFVTIYREVENMKKLLGDGIVAVCKEYTRRIECIDISEVNRPMIIAPKEDIEKLKKVRDEIKIWIGEVTWIPVEVEIKDGLVKIGRCEVPVDEALYIVKKLLDELFGATFLKKLLKYEKEVERVAYKLMTYMPKVVTWRTILGTIGMRMDGCGFELENHEALILIYDILNKVIKQLEKWNEEWEEMKDKVKTIEELRQKERVVNE